MKKHDNRIIKEVIFTFEVSHLSSTAVIILCCDQHFKRNNKWGVKLVLLVMDA